MTHLEQILAGWLPGRRWFAGKGSQIATVRVASSWPLSDELTVHLVRVTYTGDRGPETYQLPVVRREQGPLGAADGGAAYLGEVDGHHLYDAGRDPVGALALARAIRADLRRGPVTAVRNAPFDPHDPRPIATEQSNSSVVFGQRSIMKVFRRLWPGTNPDLALTRALNEAGSPYAPQTLGWLGATGEDGVEYTLAVVHEYLDGAELGWPLALGSLQQLLASGHQDTALAFAEHARALGVATASMHRDLATIFPVAPLGEDTTAALTALTTRRLGTARDAVAELRPHLAWAESAIAEFGALAPAAPAQRIHNDLHFTQVLRTRTAWKFIDFEGEPTAPITARSRPMLAMRDVAGMLRSFEYVTSFALEEAGGPAHAPHALLALQWVERMRTGYLSGYTSVTGPLADTDRRAVQFFELEKALFEIEYELDNRPQWLPVAVGSTVRTINRLLARQDPPR